MNPLWQYPEKVVGKTVIYQDSEGLRFKAKIISTREVIRETRQDIEIMFLEITGFGHNGDVGTPSYQIRAKNYPEEREKRGRCWYVSPDQIILKEPLKRKKWKREEEENG